MLSKLILSMVFTLLVFGPLRAQLFAPAKEIAGSYSPRDVRPVDLDGDGDKDIVVAANNRILLFENNGSGEFRPNGTLFIGSNVTGAISINTGDLDADGDLDVIHVAADDDRILWWPNKGNGEFGGKRNVTLDPDRPEEIITVDVDSDGDLDIVASIKNSNRIEWYANDGLGNFTLLPVVVTTQVATIEAIHVADVDGDGDPDVLSASYDDDKIAWYPNNGFGVFGPQAIIDNTAVHAWDVYSADLDLDGDIDVLAASGDSLVSWYENSGGGVFGPPQIVNAYFSWVRAISSADVDGDGDMDVLTSGIDTLWWHVNNGSGSFSGSVVISDTLGTLYSIIVDDLDGDSDVDVLAGVLDEGDLRWYDNNGTGAFTSTVIHNPFWASGLQCVDAADFDGDGDADLVSASYQDSKVAWYPNNGSGFFGSQEYIAYAAGTRDVHAADLDGDGDMDLVVAATAVDSVHWFMNDGAGNFGPAQFVMGASEPNDIYAADLDGDGDLDVLCAASGTGNVEWSPNDGLGGFGLKQTVNSNVSNASAVHAADLDGDGDLDVIAGSYGFNRVVWHANNGIGGFGTEQYAYLDTGSGVFDTNTSDVDGDGDQDVLVVTEQGNRTVWAENDGNGTFAINIISTIGNRPYSVDAADLDGDGDQDLLTTFVTSGWSGWLENDGFGNFEPWEFISQGEIATDVLAVDLDNDDDYDVVSAFSISGSITWAENLGGRGCIDALACNYDSLAYEDDGSCCYTGCGCPVLGALNYDSTATCNDGSCIFPFVARVFNDENSDGDLDINEYSLAGREMLLKPDSIMFISDSAGYFPMNVIGSGTRTFEMQPDSLFPFFTTAQVRTFDVGIDSWNQDTILFGMSDNFPMFGSGIFFYGEDQWYRCDTLDRHDLCFRNTGNEMISGTVELQYDSLFQGFLPVTPIDSIVGRRLYFQYDSLFPGEVRCLQIDLRTPTVSYIGETLLSTATVLAMAGGDTVAHAQRELIVQVACSYDPNDKQAFPAGYSSAHYIEKDTTLEYLVRFQNTGNAPATDVRILDTLDAALDLNTFELLAYSHPVFTSVNHNSRIAEFYFQNIMLPDSVNDEPNSHGFVSFRIKPKTGLPLLTELTNTAGIYFDNNPPVLTNTTWNTLYDCSLFQVNFTQTGALLTASDGDYYQWYLDGVAIPWATSQSHLAAVSGNYSVEVTTDFPCSGNSTSSFIVANIEELELEEIILFPNPLTSSAVINIGDGMKGPVRLEVYDSGGRRVRAEQLVVSNGALEFHRDDLASGTYSLMLRGNDGRSIDLPFVVR